MTGHAMTTPLTATRPFRALVVLSVLGMAPIVWRFVAGLGPVTGLSDGYPWGVWIAYDVVTGTALACGGYAMALLVYILNRGHYHRLVRPALLTSALGYTLAGFAIAIDVGRPWAMWKVPLSPNRWNLDSVLLEVALCVMAYVVVLWIELAPAFLERWKLELRGRAWRLANRVHRWLDHGLIWIIALGILLPTMHQSSLGTLMLLAGDKLHPLWHTPLVPLLFLVSCVGMGYAVVVFENTFSAVVFGHRPATRMLGRLSRLVPGLMLLFLALRVGDVAWQGKTQWLFVPNRFAAMFWVETGLFLLPALMLASPKRRGDPGHLFRTAMLVMLAGSLYRFDLYLLAYRPGDGWSYFPTVPEMLVTLGLVAVELMFYILLVSRFPSLGGAPPGPAPAPGTERA